MTRVHASDGSLIAEYARERRLYVPIQAVPKLVIEAFLSAEDKNFYKHPGIDPEGIVRAVVANLRSGGSREQGASTITQQVAKNFLRRQRAQLRAQDPRGADRAADRIDLLEGQDPRALSQRDLPRHPDARPQPYGVAAAALDYFGKSVHELTIAEAAYHRGPAEGARTTTTRSASARPPSSAATG